MESDDDTVINLVRLAHDKTVHRTLGIELAEFSKEKVVLTLEVTPKVHQPMGLLHGGVSCVLAESAASLGAALNVPADQSVVGIEINASHLRSVTKGVVSATATPIKIGRRIQVWDVQITDDQDRLTCKARVTLSVIDR